jgi:hypothetical protein
MGMEYKCNKRMLNASLSKQLQGRIRRHGDGGWGDDRLAMNKRGWAAAARCSRRTPQDIWVVTSLQSQAAALTDTTAIASGIQWHRVSLTLCTIYADGLCFRPPYPLWVVDIQVAVAITLPDWHLVVTLEPPVGMTETRVLMEFRLVAYQPRLWFRGVRQRHVHSILAFHVNRLRNEWTLAIDVVAALTPQRKYRHYLRNRTDSPSLLAVRHSFTTSAPTLAQPGDATLPSISTRPHGVLKTN